MLKNRPNSPLRKKFSIVPILLVAALAAIAIACGSDPEPTPVPPTNTPVPTNTPIPTTATPVPPTSTPVPTNTPVPTATAVPSPTALPTNTPEAKPALDDERSPAQILADASNALAELDSFRLDTEIAISIAQEGASIRLPITLRADYRRPFDSQGSVNIDLGFVSTEVKFIAIGGDVYITDPETGQWLLGGNANDMLPLNPSDFAGIDNFIGPGLLEDPEKLTLEGVEEIDGVMARRLSASVDSESVAIIQDIAGELDVNFWVGVEDGLLRRIMAVGQIGIPDTDAPQMDGLFGGFAGGDTSFEILIEYSDFNVPVQIEPPDDFIEMRSFIPDFRDDHEPREIEVLRTTLSSGWIRYDLPYEGLSVSAPPSWDVLPPNSESIDSILHTIESSDDPRFHILAERLVQGEQMPSFKLFGSDQEPSKSETFNANMTIAVDKVSDLDSLNEYANRNIQRLRPFFDLNEIEPQNIELALGEAIKLNYSIPLPSSEYPEDAAIIQYLTLRCSEVIILTFTASMEYSEELDTIFRQIANTLEVHDTNERNCLV